MDDEQHEEMCDVMQRIDDELEELCKEGDKHGSCKHYEAYLEYRPRYRSTEFLMTRQLTVCWHKFINVIANLPMILFHYKSWWAR